MNNKEKYEIASRLTTGASCGLTFLQDYLYANKLTDPAFVRSIYMLLSYNVELFLKSRVVMLGSFSNNDDVTKQLTSLSHDLIKIKTELGDNELLNMGIKRITRSSTQYLIETIENSKIKIEDFVDIRYDYIFGEMRNISKDEYKEIMKYLDNLFIILRSVKVYNSKMSKL